MAPKKKTPENKETYKNVKKLSINKIDPELFAVNGLFDDGCYGSDCDDICCKYGCHVDLGAIKIIEQNKKAIERMTKRKLEDCFCTPIIKNDDYLGGGYRESDTHDEVDMCAFHFQDKIGCSLFYLWAKKGVSKRILPTICRTFPLTWHEGELMVDRPIRSECKALEAVTPRGRTVPNLFETQKKEVFSLFDIAPGVLEKAQAKGERMKAAKKKARSLSAKKAAATRKKNAAAHKKSSLR